MSPSPIPSSRRAGLRAGVATAAFWLLLLSPGVSQRTLATGAVANLDSVMRTLARFERATGAADLRTAQRAVASLQSLAHAPPGTRRKGAGFLRGLLDRRPPLDLRIRVAAVKSLVSLAGEPEWVPYLVQLAQRADAQKDADFLYHLGFALRQLRSASAVTRLAGHLHDSRDFAVTLAAEALAMLARPKLVKAVVPHRDRVVDLARSAPPRIRAASVTLLGRLGDRTSLGALLAASRDASSAVRRAAATAIGKHLNQPGALSALGRLLKDADPRVRENAAIAFRGTRDASVIPLLAGRLGVEPLRIRTELAKSLEALGAPDFGPDPNAWKAWLASRRTAGKPEGLVLPPGATAVVKPRRYDVAYYDIPFETDRAVFIVDTSGSMDFRDGKTGRTRFDLAREELARVLNKLPKSTRFGVVTFGWTARALPERELIKADRAGVRRALEFVGRQKPTGGTNTYAALQLAFERFTEADTVYFLSDGSPTIGARIRPEALTAQVARWNEKRGVRIHTIALLVGEAPSPELRETDDAEDAVGFMRQLALHNNGASRRLP